MRTVLVLLLATATLAARPDAEAKLLGRVAGLWVDCARDLAEGGFREAAEQALARAREASPEAEGIAELAARIEALEEGTAPDAAAGRRIEKARKESAKAYDQLAKAVEDGEEYLLRAVELDPSKARVGRLVAQVKKLAGNRQRAAEAGRLLVRLREAAPDPKLDALELELARSDLALIGGKGHAMVGWLSLPKGWKKGRTLDVLVTVEGAGSNFVGNARGFVNARGSRDWIVLTPCSFSNTNAVEPAKYAFYPPQVVEEGGRDRVRFDVEGLLALLEAVRERYGGSERIAITGFSGGGNLCYAMTILHPERVRMAVPACANFSGQGLAAAQPVEGGGPPVRILTGEKDPHRDYTHGNKDMPGIEPQTDSAVQALERLGFADVRRTMLPGVGHSSCTKQVWDLLDELGS